MVLMGAPLTPQRTLATQLNSRGTSPLSAAPTGTFGSAPAPANFARGATAPAANPYMTNAQGPSGPQGPPAPTAPHPAYQTGAVSPQQALSTAGAAYGPTTTYLNQTQQGIIAGMGLNNQQLADQTQYAQGEYGVGMQNLGLDQDSINAQRYGLGVDSRYAGDIYHNQLAGNQTDRTYAQNEHNIGNLLYQSLVGQNRRQGSLYGDQLRAQLAQLGFQSSQARGVAGNDTQQLGEQVGAMGAFGSRGAGTRGAFIQSTLANALGGFNQQGNLARTQYGLSKSQLAQQQASELATRNNTFNLSNRRLAGANQADQRAMADFNHSMGLNQTQSRQLDIAASRLGVSRQHLNNILQNALNSASLGNQSGLLQAIAAMNQNNMQQGQNVQNIGGAANAILQGNG